MKKLLTCICIVYFAILNVTSAYADNQETINAEEILGSLYSKAAVLMDADSGRILYQKNGDEQLPMASTTKIMTLIVALENSNADDVITFSKYAASMPDVQLNALAGEQFMLTDILYSLMLESHNDSAVAIAEYVGGALYTNSMDAKEADTQQSKEYVKAFADMMNQKARDIGCFNTYFITPNGLDSQVTMEDGSIRIHSTTARDLAKIMSYCIKKSPKKDQFLEITRTASYNFHNMITKEDKTLISGTRSFSCNNHNAFLGMMDGALSGKTGFTNNAGYCYVGALERDDKTYVVALLACGWPNHKSYKWSDTKKLMNYGIENFEFQNYDDAIIDDTKFDPIIVKNAQTNTLRGTAYAGLEVVSTNTNENDKNGLLLRKDETIDVVYDIAKELEAPVHSGDQVGTIQYLVNGEVWKVENVILTDSIKRINFCWCFKMVFEKFSI
ncbi:D-alanyl-D-alanine carboxypeptidase (penicillin-binding protein 5/6) [Lachnotalea glycerini]|uniref:serine-type D-Ala-D-Ala carboxypeptidase n=1 Tax=Lachnotalea glycerini TaxID=1763509 RepID=A0A318EYI9_9FIRM|nr:D-alanyl-D-alanine carboxypeptidase family protein [Lachnotalea glycerini]PXV96156.1 D-alanyl-D-alanine carboxypeptidase (penicillin-binding protein 5/6) [Lachnotalea glycerini]